MNAIFSTTDGLLGRLIDSGPREGADSGSPMTHYAELFAGAGGEVGVWTSTSGGWAIDDRSDTEVVLVLSGRGRITDSDGTATDIGPGDLFVLPRGWSGRWDIHEPLEKLYVTFEGA